MKAIHVVKKIFDININKSCCIQQNQTRDDRSIIIIIVRTNGFFIE